MSQPVLERAALTEAINESWALVALLTAAALFCVPFAEGLVGVRDADRAEETMDDPI
jgi:hypothetical protein